MSNDQRQGAVSHDEGPTKAKKRPKRVQNGQAEGVEPPSNSSSVREKRNATITYMLHKHVSRCCMRLASELRLTKQ